MLVEWPFSRVDSIRGFAFLSTWAARGLPVVDSKLPFCYRGTKPREKQHKMESVEIASIDRTDKRFCVSFPLKNQSLFDSLKTFGIRMPLLLLDTKPHRVVTGFRRLEASCRLGLTRVPCIIMSMNEKDALLTAINDNIARPLNIVEGALALEKMLRFGFLLDEIYATMKLLGYEPHEKLLGKLVEVARSDDGVKEFLVRQRANMTHVELLLGFSSAERRSVIAFLGDMHMTSSQLREIFQLLLLVRLKEGKILFEEYPSLDNADAMKLFLKKRTHPTLAGLEQQLRETLQAASLPPQVSVKVDPFFEKDWVDIGIKARNVTHVKEAIKSLDTFIETGRLRSILELTKGTHRN